MADVSRRIRVQYFALLREQCGCSEEQVDTTAESVRELFDELQARHSFSLSSEQAKVVVNEEFCAWDQRLNEGDTVVFVPPVAGGSPDDGAGGDESFV